MHVDLSAPADSRGSDVRIGGQPLDLDKMYTVATTDYQLKGGDGYDMFIGQRLLVSPEDGPLVSTGLEQYIAAKGEVSPAVEGRITISR
jgi:2',3'-cyclic-nucleotide 2'-phosphodiesterase (5'-nucleotidase family)